MKAGCDGLPTPARRNTARGAAGRLAAGFTLLEVLVAFIIAALALAALFKGASGGLQSARIAAHYQEAVSRAQSRLAALSASIQPGRQSGDDGGGFLWHTTVEAGPAVVVPRPTTRLGRQDVDRSVLYAVTVVLSWQMDGGVRQVVLSTQRLGLAPPEPAQSP